MFAHRTALKTALAMAFVTFAAGGCASLDPPEARLQSLDLVGLSGASQTFAVALCVSNPNPREIRLRDATARLAVNGEDFAELRSVSPFVLPAREAVVVDFAATTTVANLPAQLARAAATGVVRYRIEGRAAPQGVAGFSVPFETTGSVSAGDLVRGRPTTTPAVGAGCSAPSSDRQQG